MQQRFVLCGLNVALLVYFKIIKFGMSIKSGEVFQPIFLVLCKLIIAHLQRYKFSGVQLCLCTNIIVTLYNRWFVAEMRLLYLIHNCTVFGYDDCLLVYFNAWASECQVNELTSNKQICKFRSFILLFDLLLILTNFL